MADFSKHIQKIIHKNNTLQYSHIPWDSNFLNNQTIEILEYSYIKEKDFIELINIFQKNCKVKQGDLLVWKLQDNQKLIQYLIQSLGFYWIETSITASASLDTFTDTFIDTNVSIVEASRKDKKEILSIAESTFIHDRFHRDPFISKETADHRFKSWVNNSFSSTDRTFSFYYNGDLAGFFIIAEHDNNANLRLAGIKDSIKGKGIGKILYRNMYSFLKLQNIHTFTAIISLQNIPVVNVYLSLDSTKFTNPVHIYHKWI